MRDPNSRETADLAAREHAAVAAGVAAQAALGALELALDRPHEALEHLRRAARFAEDHQQREPAVVQWASDFIDAAVLSGDLPAAGAVVDRLGHQARATGRIWASAVAARGRALLADEHYDAAFAAALDVLEQTTAPFERGRTCLWWGRRLRRDGQRSAAPERLREARAVFEAIGARHGSMPPSASYAPAACVSGRARRPTETRSRRRSGRSPRWWPPGRPTAGREEPVSQPKDGRGPPEPDLSQARHPVAQPARATPSRRLSV